MISYKGKLSLAVAIPVLLQAVLALDIPGIQGQVLGLIRAIAQISIKPPTVAGTLLFAANLAAHASIAVVPPSVSIVASLEAKLALLQLKLQLMLVIKNLLVSGRVRVYEYDGGAGQFGSELATTIAGPEAEGGIAPGQSTFAVILLAEGGTAGETTLKTLRSGA